MLIDWQLTLIAVIFFPNLCGADHLAGEKSQKASKGSLSASVSQASLLVEMLSGIRVVKGSAWRSNKSRDSENSPATWSNGMKGARAKEQVNPIIETISMLGLGLLVVYIAYKQQTVDEMVAFLTGMAFDLYAGQEAGQSSRFV